GQPLRAFDGLAARPDDTVKGVLHDRALAVGQQLDTVADLVRRALGEVAAAGNGTREQIADRPGDAVVRALGEALGGVVDGVTSGVEHAIDDVPGDPPRALQVIAG